MLLAKIRGTRAEIRLIDNSPIFVERSVRKLGAGRFEALAVMEPSEASLLEIKGYDIVIQGDAKEILAQRLPGAFRHAAAFRSAEDLFDSVASNDAYMTPGFVDAWTANLATVFPAIASKIVLPYPTWEGRGTTAVRLRAGDAPNRPAVLFISGVHAGELGGPDSCVWLLYLLLSAYRAGAPIQLGNRTVSADRVQALLHGLDLYVFPCVNPDGRNYVLTAQDWWRKNRNPNVGMNAVGVDINRNFDFLWSSGLGSSLLPQDDTYRGPAPFSEPETRNVEWLRSQAQPDYFMDLHGPIGDLLYSWGDAADQSTDPTMNFMNPAWNGRRPGPPYGEYLDPADLAFVQRLGTRVALASQSVAGSDYGLQQSYDGVHATVGTSDDYNFSRHLADPTARKTYAFTFEYGGWDYFPAYPDMMGIISEADAAMLEFCDAAVTA